MGLTAVLAYVLFIALMNDYTFTDELRLLSAYVAGNFQTGWAILLTGAVTVALVSGLGGRGGLGFGLEVGLGLGLLKSTWPYFAMARVYLVVRRKAPRALMSFLQDAHEHRGVLRQAGPVYQFRHIDLQRHLAAQHNENRPRARTGL